MELQLECEVVRNSTGSCRGLSFIMLQPLQIFGSTSMSKDAMLSSRDLQSLSFFQSSVSNNTLSNVLDTSYRDGVPAYLMYK